MSDIASFLLFQVGPTLILGTLAVACWIAAWESYAAAVGHRGRKPWDGFFPTRRRELNYLFALVCGILGALLTAGLLIRFVAIAP